MAAEKEFKATMLNKKTENENIGWSGLKSIGRRPVNPAFFNESNF